MVSSPVQKLRADWRLELNARDKKKSARKIFKFVLNIWIKMSNPVALEKLRTEQVSNIAETWKSSHPQKINITFTITYKTGK